MTDASGARIPGASVTLTHLATNTALDAVSDERGQYRTPPLRIGEYEIAVRLDGFRTFVRRGVVLNIGDVRNVDATLDVGSLTETITVDATPPPLNTSDSTVGTVVTNQQIAALPLNGRDYLDQDEHKWNVRVDQVFSPDHNLFVRVSSQVFENRPTSPLPADADGNYVVSGAGDITNSKSVVVTHNAVWTPNLIGSFRVGYNRLDRDERVPDQDLRGVGIPGVDTNHPVFSQIAITGYRSLGISNVPNDDDSRTAQISGDISWTNGGHTVKTGVQAYRLETDFLSSQRSSGIFNFNGQYTGDPFADFLLGYASSASLSTWATLNYRTN